MVKAIEWARRLLAGSDEEIPLEWLLSDIITEEVSCRLFVKILRFMRLRELSEDRFYSVDLQRALAIEMLLGCCGSD